MARRHRKKWDSKKLEMMGGETPGLGEASRRAYSSPRGMGQEKVVVLKDTHRPQKHIITRLSATCL